ncbi:hypothetical protein [Streptomyces sp. bgisy154]|uniref:hypothetical protein n=1 Tax=Streptomyces sp. bgisy154 TaxID=3413794 RepID=UPI003D722B08
MAQLVKLEPGDVLVLSNLSEEAAEGVAEMAARLKDMLGIEHIIAFAGDVDLSKVSADAVAGS